MLNICSAYALHMLSICTYIEIEIELELEIELEIELKIELNIDIKPTQSISSRK